MEKRKRIQMNLLLLAQTTKKQLWIDYFPVSDPSLQLILYPKAKRRSSLSREHWWGHGRAIDEYGFFWIRQTPSQVSKKHTVLHCSLLATDRFIDLVLQRQLTHAVWKKCEVSKSCLFADHFAAMGCSRSKPLDINEMASFPSNLMIFVRDDHSRTVEQEKLRRDLHKVQWG